METTLKSKKQLFQAIIQNLISYAPVILILLLLQYLGMGCSTGRLSLIDIPIVDRVMNTHQTHAQNFNTWSEYVDIRKGVSMYRSVLRGPDGRIIADLVHVGQDLYFVTYHGQYPTVYELDIDDREIIVDEMKDVYNGAQERISFAILRQ